MSEYPKINSLWKREGFDFVRIGKKPTSKKLIEGDHSCPEFANIFLWSVDEKIDGMNIRIMYKEGQVSYAGRTKDAMIPPPLLEVLQREWDESIFKKAFPEEDLKFHGSKPYPDVTLYGEGYGPKIQSGGNYSKEPSFILFDIKIGEWWLTWEKVREIALQLRMNVVPHIGIMTEAEILRFVQSKPLSRCSIVPQVMEGVVCRSEPLVLFRNGDPVKFKLKCKEF